MNLAGSSSQHLKITEKSNPKEMETENVAETLLHEVLDHSYAATSTKEQHVFKSWDFAFKFFNSKIDEDKKERLQVVPEAALEEALCFCKATLILLQN